MRSSAVYTVEALLTMTHVPERDGKTPCVRPTRRVLKWLLFKMQSIVLVESFPSRSPATALIVSDL